MTSVSADLAGYPARYFAAWSQRDLATALDVIAENIEWLDPSLPEAITDRDGAAGFFTAAWSGFPDMAFHPIGEPLVDAANNRVTQEWRMTGTHTGEGSRPGCRPPAVRSTSPEWMSGRSTAPGGRCRSTPTGTSRRC